MTAPSTKSTDQLLEQALRLRRAGQRDQEEAVYRKILADQPDHPQALRGLIVLAVQTSRQTEALCLIDRAIAANPPDVANYLLRGSVLETTGQLDAAITAYHRAIELQFDNPIAHFNLANALRLQGRSADAIAAYRQALSLRPNLAQAANNLGIALAATGQVDESIAAYQQALGSRPDYAEAHNNLAQALNKSGRVDEAATAAQKALTLRPDFAEAFCNLGDALAGKSDNAAAAVAYQKGLALRPNLADAHHNLAIALRRLRQFDQAVAAAHAALALRPQFADALLNLGNIFSDQSKFDQSIAAYQQAIAIQPQFAEAHQNLGMALARQHRHDAAIAASRQAISINPALFEAWMSLCIALAKTGRVDQAIAAGRQAVALQPASPRPYTVLAGALSEADLTDEALATIQISVALAPQLAESYVTQGRILQGMGQVDQAIASYRQALQLADDPQAHFNLAIALLLRGEYRAGWQEYEWRWKTPDNRSQPRDFPQPAWDGSDLAGRRILLHTEQGLGDAVHFARYLPLVAARGGHVILQCPHELVRLFQNVPRVRQVIPLGQPLPDFDLHLPIGSLPRLFDTTFQTIPAAAPYLTTDPALVESWRTRLADEPRPKIGLVWAGNAAHSNDRRRSLPLADFAPLAAIPNLRFISLQKGPAAAQAAAPPPGLTITDWTADLQDFADTAALIANLDLVITVDTAVAHLAGALAKPVWILLSFLPDWRWLLERDDSPWYPTARLFRQPAIGDWQTPLAGAASALRSFRRS